MVLGAVGMMGKSQSPKVQEQTQTVITEQEAEVVTPKLNQGRSIASKSTEGTFTLKFNFRDVRLEIKEKAKDYNQALTQSAKKCFDFYSEKFNKVTFSEETGLDIIDVCVNPR